MNSLDLKDLNRGGSMYGFGALLLHRCTSLLNTQSFEAKSSNTSQTAYKLSFFFATHPPGGGGGELGILVDGPWGRNGLDRECLGGMFVSVGV